MMIFMSTREQFLAEIEAFLARHDMSPSAFGMLSRGNRMIVFRYRKGASPNTETMDHIRAWMAEFESPRPTKQRRNHGARAAAA